GTGRLLLRGRRALALRFAGRPPFLCAALCGVLTRLSRTSRRVGPRRLTRLRLAGLRLLASALRGPLSGASLLRTRPLRTRLLRRAAHRVPGSFGVRLRLGYSTGALLGPFGTQPLLQALHVLREALGAPLDFCGALLSFFL